MPAKKSAAYRALSVNVPAALLDRIDAHVEQRRPFVRRHAVHLAAVVLGLDLLDQHPERLGDALEAAERFRGT